MGQSSSLPSGGMAEWKEGQLFPEGWEDMNAFKKVIMLMHFFPLLICPNIKSNPEKMILHCPVSVPC